MMRVLVLVVSISVAQSVVAFGQADRPEVEDRHNRRLKQSGVDLRSEELVPGLSLPESVEGVYGVSLITKEIERDEAKGFLVLERNLPTFDEFGRVTTGGALSPLKLECRLKLVKSATIQAEVKAQPPETELKLEPEKRYIFEIIGPKITSQLFLVSDVSMESGKLLVKSKEGKVKYAVTVRDTRPVLSEPCHPGCFPAGTSVHIASGTKLIEAVRQGDSLTPIGPDGNTSQIEVASVFVTDNRLLEVRTDDGNLVTTETQPLCLSGGGFCTAGALKEGDRIWQWKSGERRAVTVRMVSPTGRKEKVFNVVLGDSTIFIAGGFLARSKPLLLPP